MSQPTSCKFLALFVFPVSPLVGCVNPMIDSLSPTHAHRNNVFLIRFADWLQDALLWLKSLVSASPMICRVHWLYETGTKRVTQLNTPSSSHRTNKDCVWGAPNISHPSEMIFSALSHRATAAATLRANPLSWPDNTSLSFNPHLMSIKELRKSYFLILSCCRHSWWQDEGRKGREEMRGGSQHGVSQAEVLRPC